MNELYQDVTITLNLSEMTPAKYKQTMAMLELLSEGNINTHTYSFETAVSSPLSEEHKRLLAKLVLITI